MNVWTIAVCLASLVSSTLLHAEIRWVRGEGTTNGPLWGVDKGLQWALHPAGFSSGAGGPRGLIRIGYPTLPNFGYDLINFIAVEPITTKGRGYSELEKSTADGKPGKRFVVRSEPGNQTGFGSLAGGKIRRLGDGAEELIVMVSVERFENGAHVWLRLAQRSDQPNELEISVEAEADSEPIQSCILTATMGNKARTRILYLKDGPVSSQQLYSNYRDDQFAPQRTFGLAQLPRAVNGDVMVTIVNDEENPSVIHPFGKPGFWDYQGFKVAQYWRKRSNEVRPTLECAVNGRFTYWMSKQPIPGGVAFENFELREPFISGQTFVFGIAQPSSLQKF